MAEARNPSTNFLATGFGRLPARRSTQVSKIKLPVGEKTYGLAGQKVFIILASKMRGAPKKPLKDPACSGVARTCST